MAAAAFPRSEIASAEYQPCFTCPSPQFPAPHPQQRRRSHSTSSMSWIIILRSSSDSPSVAGLNIDRLTSGQLGVNEQAFGRS